MINEGNGSLTVLALFHTFSSSLFQGALVSLMMALGGSVAKAGSLTDCPFQGDSSSYNSGQLTGISLSVALCTQTFRESWFLLQLYTPADHFLTVINYTLCDINKQ